MILQGDCLNEMRAMEDNSVDSVVTDPPYGISFMNKKWDYDVPKVEVWQEAMRALKPGGHILVACGTRTQHRMAVNIEDAGFEIRDIVSWIYGSGFPKSHNIGKAVDKLQGNEREAIEPTGRYKYSFADNTGKFVNCRDSDKSERKDVGLTKGTSEWEGWGTALKPAMELWTLARKPLSEKTVAENVLKHGTGGINIDECRIGYEKGEVDFSKRQRQQADCGEKGWSGNVAKVGSNIQMFKEKGRFPANLILDGSDEVVELFPETKNGGQNKTSEKGHKSSYIGGEVIGTANETKFANDSGNASRFFKTIPQGRFPANLIHDNSEEVRECFPETNYATKPQTQDTGKTSMFGIGSPKNANMSLYGKPKDLSASRFFYCAKASKSERNKGCEGLEEKVSGHRSNFRCQICGYQKASGTPCKCENPVWEEIPLKPQSNNHPTVKPIALMEYLIKMVTPKGGTVLDPFMGSGTTGIACKKEGFEFIGIELDKDYFEIAKARIENLEHQHELF